MKKRFLSVLAFALAICMILLTLTACLGDTNEEGGSPETGSPETGSPETGNPEDGGNPPAAHTHDYTVQKASADYLATAASCTSKATYYYSCACGEAGTQTFEGGVTSCKYENGACKWCETPEPAETDGLLYSLVWNDEAYMVIGYEGTASEVYIPAMHDGKPVVQIRGRAFAENATITSVIIGDNVKYLNNEVFADCVNLRSVVIGRSITEIDERAFAWCESLESVILPDALTVIDESAFWMCSSLASVRIPYGVTTIGEEAFGRCDSLVSVRIPGSVTSIGKKAFSWCLALQSIEVDAHNAHYSSLQGNLYNKDQTTLLQYAMGKTETDFTIPDSVTTIGYYAFAYCENIVNLVIPNSVTKVEYYAFGEVGGLQYNVKDGLCYLGNAENPYLFLACAENKSITTAVVDKNCRFINDFAFDFCTKLTTVTFEQGSKLTSIGSCAFFYCDALEGIEIPTGVTHLNAPFYACPVLERITFVDAENWYITDDYDDFEARTGGTAFNVTDGAANVTSFLETYQFHYWYRKTA